MSDVPKVGNPINALTSDETPPPEEKAPVVPKEKEEPLGEIKEDEEEPERGESEDEDEDSVDDDEDDDDEPAPATKEPPRIAAIKKEFPDIFKKYPDLKTAFFRVQEYQQVAATPAIAAEAVEAAEVFQQLVKRTTAGDIEPVLDAVYDEDPNGLKLLCKNFLPILHKKSEPLFREVIDPIFNNFFARVHEAGVKNGDQNLALAAKYCKRFFSGSAEIGKPVDIKPTINQNTEADAVRNEVAQRDQLVFYQQCQELAEPELDKYINDGLDPDNVLPEALREKTIKEIRELVYKRLKKNDGHIRTMVALQKSAKLNGYNKEHRKKIAKAVVRAAREIIPAARAKVRKEMLGNLLDKNNTGDPSIPAGSGKTPNVGGEKVPASGKQIDWSKTSIREALDQV